MRFNPGVVKFLTSAPLTIKPFSVDLRQRVVDAYAQGEGTIDQLAAHLSVSPSSVERWVRRYKTTGSVAPTPNPAGKANAIVTEEDMDRPPLRLAR
jgi:transposase